MVAASGSTFFYPAIGAYLPALAEDEAQLGPANSAWASLGNLSFIIGPALGGVLIAAGGVTWRSSSTPCRSCSSPRSSGRSRRRAPGAGRRPRQPRRPRRPRRAEPGTPGRRRAGAPRQRPPLPQSRCVPITGLGLIQVIVGFLDGGIQSVTIVLAVTVLNAGEEANGYLNAAIGVGGLIGAVVSGVLVLRAASQPDAGRDPPRVRLGVAVLGASPCSAWHDRIGLSAAGSIVLDVVLTTVFQRLVPDAFRGRALGVLMTANTVSAAAGAFVMPVLVVALGAPLALGLVARAHAPGTLVGLATARWGDEPPGEPVRVDPRSGREAADLRRRPRPASRRPWATSGRSRSRPARSSSSRASRPTASSSSRPARSPSAR